MSRKLVFSMVFIALVVIGSAGFLGLRDGGTEAAVPPEPPPTVAVERGDIQLSVTAPGQLSNSSQTKVQARVTGIVEALKVRPGDRVEANEEIARLGEHENFENAVAEAQIRVAEAQMALDEINPGLMLAEVELELLEAQQAYDEAQRRVYNLDYSRGSREAVDAAKDDLRRTERAMKAAQGKPRLEAQMNALKAEREAALARLNALLGDYSEREVAEARAKFQSAKALLDGVQEKYDRLETGQNPEVALAEARLQDAQADLAAARKDLESLVIRAPFDGVVVSTGVRVGETVTAGAELLTIIDPGALEAETTVVEEDLPLVRVGQAAELFFDALPDAQGTGLVSRIVPERVEGDRPTYTVYITLDEVPSELVPGMTVDASIVIDEREQALRLPRSVLQARPNGEAQVEVWTGTQVEERIIQVGLRGDSFAEVLSGLQEGEQVVAR